MELKDAMNKRRSIRKYQKKEVSDAMIETLIEAAIQAPTWKNSQTGRYHVVRSQQMLEKLKWEGLARFNGENAEDAPILIVATFVKDRSGFEKSGEPSNELGNGWGCYDLGLQTMNLLLAATELGLGTLVMGIRDEKRIRDLLSIPPQETIVSVIAVGGHAGILLIRKRVTLQTRLPFGPWIALSIVLALCINGCAQRHFLL